MTRGTRLMRWINDQLRNWWPILTAVVGGVVLAAAVMVVAKVDDDRAELRAQRDLLAEQSEHLRGLVEADHRRDEESTEAFSAAIAEVRALMAEQFAAHDHNVALKLNDMLQRIASLLGRPAGVPVDPVTAQPLATHTAPGVAAPSPRSAPSTSSRPGGTAAAATTTTTTTTTPDQRRCADQPDHPRC